MFNSDDFRNSKEDLLKLVQRDLEAGKGLYESVTTLAQAFGVPLVCIYEFVMEDMPEHTKACEDKIKFLNCFYGVK